MSSCARSEVLSIERIGEAQGRPLQVREDWPAVKDGSCVWVLQWMSFVLRICFEEVSLVEVQVEVYQWQRWLTLVSKVGPQETGARKEGRSVRVLGKELLMVEGCLCAMGEY